VRRRSTLLQALDNAADLVKFFAFGDEFLKIK
jgi:hypothetical protein